MFLDDSEEVCRRVLAPFHDDLLEVILRAIARFHQIPADQRAPLAARPKVRANVIWAYMQEEAERLFGDREGVRAREAYDTTTYHIGEVDEDVIVRFKHLNEDGLSSNYPTDRSKDYNAQLTLDGISPTAIRIDVGYQLNDLGTQAKSILVSHRNGKRLGWKYEIEQLQSGEVLPLPFPQERPAAGTRVHGRIESEAADDE